MNILFLIVWASGIHTWFLNRSSDLPAINFDVQRFSDVSASMLRSASPIPTSSPLIATFCLHPCRYHSAAGDPLPAPPPTLSSPASSSCAAWRTATPLLIWAAAVARWCWLQQLTLGCVQVSWTHVCAHHLHCLNLCPLDYSQWGLRRTVCA